MTANYGDPPTNMENAITAYLKEVLKDPDSLKDLRIGTPKRGWTNTNYGKDPAIFIKGYLMEFAGK